METIRVLARFHTAHRQLQHPGQCRFPHGHTWRAELVLRTTRFPRDDMDMSLDFGALKAVFKSLDHKILVTANDPDFLDPTRWDPCGVVLIPGRGPSVENVADYCRDQVLALIAAKYPAQGLTYELRLTIQETDHNFFTVESSHVI
ncbi:MAG: 6-carboxytetrahydropterin synthase [Fimbriimonadaceae bacterium]|nr:6-carboxytetrahydropterin synthase [Fimbriimonadaceae bacterium]